MKITYVDKSFHDKTLALIDEANEIVDEYKADNYDLTLRQLYYQLVARDIIPNNQRSYKRLVNVVSDARRAGLMHWDAIVDRTRNLATLAHWGNPAEIVRATSEQFRIDRWKDQPVRIEVWVEKEALIGVVARACTRHDVPYFACRGFPSDSEMWAAAMRFRKYDRHGQSVHILHFGDHDPSGIDMTRDIVDRLELFAARDVEVERMALNMDQIRLYNPPPNTAKKTDSRFAGYKAMYGPQSWELDALEPRVINQIISDRIVSLRDDDIWERASEVEADGRRRLSDIAAELALEYDDEDDDDDDVDEYDDEYED